MRPRMRRARWPRLQGATTKAMPVSIVEEERRRRRGPDWTRAKARVGDRAPAPPAPEGLAGLYVTLYANAGVWPASRRGCIHEHGYLARCSRMHTRKP